MTNTHINDNEIHLTQAEKLNLKNLSISVKLYGATGDGDADDTSAFTAALEENRRVYVPGGTYKITGELIIPENCELELGQDAILDFVPSNKRVLVNEETGNNTTVDIEADEFRCITQKPSSRLIGNHATVRVPYSFKGNVICIAANPADDTSCKSPRYLKDINIVKAIESGEYADIHAALDNVTDGTALLIEGTEVDEAAKPGILWGVEALGIRIAGAFDYGIRCINTNYEESGKTEWKYETKIDALIDGCRTGLYMDHYSNARISAVVKTRKSYMSEDSTEDPRYAEYGIHLVNSGYIDLKNSRIMKIDPESGITTVSNEFKHIDLVGDCYGLMIENSLCPGADGTGVRDLISTNTPANYDNLTVLGEPMTGYFNYTDEVSTNGLLYHNYKIDSSTVPGSLLKTAGTTSTCLIPCTKNSSIVVKDFLFVTDDNPNRIAFYNESGAQFGPILSHNSFNCDYLGYNKVKDRENEYIITLKDISGLNNLAYIRMCCNTENVGLRPMIYYGEKIGDDFVIDHTRAPIYLKDGCLKDGIYAKVQYIDGLEKYIDEYLNPDTEIQTPSDGSAE